MGGVIMGVVSGDCCGMARYQTVMNIGNTWSAELRAPMVTNMRGIAPKQPEDVKNAFVDYPYIWNWLLTANFLVLGFDTFLVISTFLQREMMVRFYLVLSLANIIHSLALVLPTILINMLDSGIAHFITAERENLSLNAATEERRRPFDGLVIDWYVNHGFAIFSIVAMVIFNIYAWVVINNYRMEVKITGGQDLEAYEKMRQEMRRNERMRYDEEHKLPPLNNNSKRY